MPVSVVGSEPMRLQYAPDLVAGVAMGVIADAVGLEVFVHQQLAHRNLETHPYLAAAARTLMVVTGMSPNRAALKHREHHTINDVEPLSFIGALGEVIDFTSGDEDLLVADDKVIQFPGYSYSDDPLLKQDETGRLSFRYDPILERMASSGPIGRIFPALATTVAIGAVNKKLGRDMPYKRAAIFMAGAILTLAAFRGSTVYGEARSGKVAGQMPIKGLLKNNLARHQEHHDAPWDHLAGSRKRDRLVFRLLEKTGIAKRT